jgi:hypothetical protein
LIENHSISHGKIPDFRSEFHNLPGDLVTEDLRMRFESKNFTAFVRVVVCFA